MSDDSIEHSLGQDLYIGVDIGGTKIGVCIGNYEALIFREIRFPTKTQPKVVIEDISKAIRFLISEYRGDLKAIGIICGGPLDANKGIIQSPPNLPEWIDIPIVKILQREFDIPIYLQNDANACALAEWKWGNGRGCKNMIFLTFGTGLGAGLILSGRLYNGHSGLAGEVGHIRISDHGSICYGKKGSWESYCSGTGISAMYKDHFNEQLSAKEICRLAEQGDKKALYIIDISATYLGKGLALLMDILNPEKIVIGSIFTRSESLFRSSMEKSIHKEALEQTSRDCLVLPSLLGEALGDMAALGLAMSGNLDQEQ
ncbi:MAG: ROK family protein [Treponema sp.]|nr:ROK family protein [Treponema sp.]